MTDDLTKAAALIRQRGAETCARRQGYPHDCAPWLGRDRRCPGCPADEAEEYAEIVESVRGEP